MDVVLVDENDEAIGVMEKIQAHQKALLHRAFSIFIFNKKNEMLLHQRAFSKYHSAGLWTNACCSHPQQNENLLQAATKRLQEEMGFVTPITKAFDFIYKAAFDNGLTEHEFDHVFIGNYDGEIHPNANEVADYLFLNIADIKKNLKENPSKFTVWFAIAFPKVLAYLQIEN
jgi:isopentenyl-diphosphate Delta-isomerase